MDNLLDLFLNSGFGLSLFNEDLLQLDRNMPKSDFLALLVLERRGTATMSELAADLRAPLSTVTGIVHRLARKHLLVRERDPEDRRSILTHLTPEGVQLAASSRQQLAGLFARMQSALTAEEMDLLFKLVQKLLAALATPPAAEQPMPPESRLHRIKID